MFYFTLFEMSWVVSAITAVIVFVLFIKEYSGKGRLRSLFYFLSVSLVAFIWYFIWAWGKNSSYLGMPRYIPYFLVFLPGIMSIINLITIAIFIVLTFKKRGANS